MIIDYRSLILEFLEKCLFVAWRVELDDFQWIQGVDLVHILFQLVSWFGLYLLNLLQST